ncbi:MAG: 2-hydroxyacid dehydrogenase [Marmoricola sp.]
MTTSAGGPLVWLPFEPDELGELPESLHYEHVDPDGLPDSGDEVEFYVLPYRFRPADGEVLARLPRLKAVQTMSAGVEHIRRFVPDKVQLCNGRGIHDTSTAELALTLILASLRGIPQFVHAQEEAAWRPQIRESLADKLVLIVGYGQIGEAIEARVLPFEAEVTRVARSARDGVHAIEELPGLLPRADVVVLIVPGTEDTKGLFDAEMLGHLKDGALLVNIARGSVVDIDALLAELRSERIHAALDVVDPEPLPSDHPLWQAPNLLLVPHVGGNSTAMEPRARKLIREQLHRFAAGEPLANVVSGDY